MRALLAACALLAHAGLASAQGTIETIAGTGAASFGGDDGPAVAAFLRDPVGVAVDGAGNVFVVDFSNNRIRKVDAGGTITTIAGTGVSGFSGDGGPATLARLSLPFGVAVDGAGNVFIADGGNRRIRRVDALSGVISTVAGSGSNCFPSTSPCGDGGPATTAQLGSPNGVAVDGAGNLYIADAGVHRIRKVDAASGTMTSVAGTGVFGFNGDGPATSVQLGSPNGVAVDGAGNFYVADTFNHRVAKVDPSGNLTTIAGNGVSGYGGDAGPATAAMLSLPFAVHVDGAGDVFVADTANNRVRRVDAASGVIDTVAGNGLFGFGGDGGPATAAVLAFPSGVAMDSDGNLLIADRLNHRVRLVVLNQVPDADAGFDDAVECNCPAGARVRLDGSESSDPDGDVLTYTWTGPFSENGGTVSGVSPTVTLPLGVHTVTLTVTDPSGASDTDTVEITVEDTTAPTVTLTLSPGVLWPANHKLIRITATIDVDDDCGSNATVKLVSIESNESDNGRGDGNTTNDIQEASYGTDDRSFLLRAERSDRGRGRVYEVTYVVTDASGNDTEVTAEVRVPHDQGGGHGHCKIKKIGKRCWHHSRCGHKIGKTYKCGKVDKHSKCRGRSHNHGHHSKKRR